MSNGLDTLTVKERETLRLILRGHDAKSMARELGLSVHTINERLRGARRKLEVTSSKEAARKLYESEGGAYKNLAYEELGEAADPPLCEASIEPRVMRQGLPKKLIVGVFLMPFCIAAILLAAQAVSPDIPPRATTASATDRTERAVSPAMQEELESADRFARSLLEIIDAADFDVENRADVLVDPEFTAWNGMIERRQAHGRTVEREAQRIDMIDREGLDHWVVRYRTDFEHFQGAYEKVTLAYDEGTFIALDYAVE